MKSDTSSSRSYIKIPGISKLHSLEVSDRKIYGLEYTCTECPNSGVCESCSLLKHKGRENLVKPDQIDFISVEDQENEMDESQ